MMLHNWLFLPNRPHLVGCRLASRGDDQRFEQVKCKAHLIYLISTPSPTTIHRFINFSLSLTTTKKCIVFYMYRLRCECYLQICCLLSSDTYWIRFVLKCYWVTNYWVEMSSTLSSPFPPLFSAPCKVKSMPVFLTCLCPLLQNASKTGASVHPVTPPSTPTRCHHELLRHRGHDPPEGRGG